jgi:hypothetical protein
MARSFLFRLALHVAVKVGPYLHARSRVRVQRMASEDSVEDLIHRTSALLAVVIHRVCDLHDRRQASRLTMEAVVEEIHCVFEELHIGASRGHPHVSPHEWQDMAGDVASRVDREHEHVRIASLRPDPSAFEHLLRHFEELPTPPVLIHEELRLNVVAEGVGRVPLDGETPAALTLHDAGHKPASGLCTRQSFLLIVRTRHIVTVPPAWDGTRSARYSDVPAYS